MTWDWGHAEPGPRLTCEEVPDLLDEEPGAAETFLHLGAAAAHLGFQALHVGLHLRGGLLRCPYLLMNTAPVPVRRGRGSSQSACGSSSDLRPGTLTNNLAWPKRNDMDVGFL